MAAILIERQKAGAGTSLELLASAARTASGTGSVVISPPVGVANTVVFEVEVSAQSGTTPTLDVAVQVSLDAGTNWFNLARFSQYAAATGRKALKVRFTESFTTEMVPEADPSVGTGVVVNNAVWGDQVRVKWAIAGTTPSYTFSVAAYPFFSP